MGFSKNNNEEALLEAIKFYQSALMRYLDRNDQTKVSQISLFQVNNRNPETYW